MRFLWKKGHSESPYLNSSERLGDVIAAIQAMGTYKFYKLDFDGWAYRIGNNEKNSDYWKTIFSEHPEFFRVGSDGRTASLVIRRQHPKLYDVDSGQLITTEIYRTLNQNQKMRISRAILSPSEIATLINTAIQIHTRTMERARDARWWLPLITAGAGFIGAILGALLR